MNEDSTEMPGLALELFDGSLKWHAIQITIYENATKKGKQIKANIKAKLDRSESWECCSLDQMIALQGRGRDANRTLKLLGDTCVKHNEYSVRDHMMKMNHLIRSRVIEEVRAKNSTFKESFLRSGFGRAKATYTPGVPNLRPLNPGVQAVYDGSSKTFGLNLGTINKIAVLDRKPTVAQAKANIIAYDIWLLDPPVYNIPAGEETPSERLRRFMALAAAAKAQQAGS